MTLANLLIRRSTSASFRQGWSLFSMRPHVRTFSTPAGNVFEVDQASFDKLVMKSEVPVILDCYADWCGPCKQLGPVLESAVNAQNGKVKMAKLDTDKNQQLAAALGVKSLPTVYGIANKKMVDSFIGMQTPEKITQFVQRVVDAGAGGNAEANQLKTTFENLVALLTSEQAADEQVVTVYNQLAQFNPFAESKEEASKEDAHMLKAINAYARVGLIKRALAIGELETAKVLAKDIVDKFYHFKTDELVKKTLSMVKIQEMADGEETSDAQGDGESNIYQEVEANPNSCEAHIKLARKLFVKGDQEAAVKEALVALKLDKHFDDGAARKLLIEFFDAIGQDNPITKQGRKKMSAYLL